MGDRDSPPPAPGNVSGAGATPLFRESFPVKSSGWALLRWDGRQKPCRSCAALLPTEQTRPCRSRADAFPTALPSSRAGPWPPQTARPLRCHRSARGRRRGERTRCAPRAQRSAPADCSGSLSSSSRDEDEDVPAFLHPTATRHPAAGHGVETAQSTTGEKAHPLLTRFYMVYQKTPSRAIISSKDKVLFSCKNGYFFVSSHQT